MARAFAFALFLALLVPAPTRAQTASETAAARELFMQGLAAIEEERWADAEGLFNRSYDLVPRPSTLVNLATAQVELGRLVEARESYRRFLAEPGNASGLVRDARRALSDLEPRVAHIRVSVPNLAPDDEVRLDGEPISHAAIETRLPVNPGPRRVEVARDGAVVGRASAQLEEGEERELTVPLTARVLGTEPADPDPGGPDEGGEDILTSPWLWIGVGAAVLVGAGIAIGVAAGQPRDPYVGNLGPGRVTF